MVANSRRKPKSERRDHEFYPTTPLVAQVALSLLPVPHKHSLILDPGAGNGVWGQAALKVWPNRGLTIVGVDIADHDRPTGYDKWFRSDFIHFAKTQRPASYDLVIGNPPYGELAEPFIWSALHLLKPGGHLIYLLPLEFLGGIGRGSKLYQQYPPRTVFVSMRRMDFVGGSGDMRNHALYWWTTGITKKPEIEWFDYRAEGEQMVLL